MINQLHLIGRVGNDPEIKTLEGGTKVARLSVATSESWKDKFGEWQETTEWHNVVVWRDLAERCVHIRKGMLVAVIGKVSYRKYKDKDGNERTATDVVASVVRRLEKSEAAQASGGAMPWETSAPAAHAKPVAPAKAAAPPISDDEALPF